MHYLLFIPGAEAKTPAVALPEIGLADFVQGVETIPVSPGPDEKVGLLCAWRKPGKNERMHFNAKEQVWIPSLPNGPEGAGRGRYWVGFWNDSPITPEDLKRPFQHYGPLIELGDKNSWRIPVIEELPRDFVRAEDGSWQGIVQAEYHDLWMESRDWTQKISSKKISIDYFSLLDYCEKVLRQNYRLLPEVVSHLRLFNSANLAQVFSATLGKTLKEDE